MSEAEVEQAALRRVATLVARAAPQEEVFAAVNEELGRLVGATTTSLMRFEADDTLTLLAVWGSGAGTPVGRRGPVDGGLRAVRDDGRTLRFGPAPLPDAGPFVEEAARLGLRSAIGVPITVGGRVWGVGFAASSSADPFPDDTEARIAGFTELVATALANAQARSELEHLAEEQAALRRVAERAAAGATEPEVLDAVVSEAARLVGVGFAVLGRYEADGSSTLVALHGGPPGLRPGIRGHGEGDGVVQVVRRTGRPVRLDSLADVPGFWPETARALGFTTGAGVPVAIDGGLWGILLVATTGDVPLPLAVEDRLARFAGLVGTAVAGARARTGLRALADEQAALRRVAELVARGGTPEEVFGAVVTEASGLLGDLPTALIRYDADGFGTVIAICGGEAPVGLRVSTDGDSASAEVRRTGRPSRTDDYAGSTLEDVARAHNVRAAVAVPVIVEGRVWGNVSSSSPDGPLARGVEARLAQFAELAGTAIAGAQARSELRALADEQAALRRVAELVARGVGQDELFASVAEEASRLIAGESATLLRFDGDGLGGVTVVASYGGPAPVGTRATVAPDDEGITAEIMRTGKPARVDDYGTRPGRAWARDDYGVGSSVGVPIFVEHRLWGVLAITSPEGDLPAGAEVRLQQFAALIAAALANAQARAEVQQLADEQAALRRVAELVARGAEPGEVLEAVAVETSRLLGDVPTTLLRFGDDGAAVVVAHHGGTVRVGMRVPAEGDTAAAAAPIAAGGRLWGMLAAGTKNGPLPAGSEQRLQQFADLVAAAISNAEHREQLTASRARVVAAADESRRRVQRDVHDGAQQRLVQAVITLKLAREALGPGEGEAPALVEESLHHVERATAELRDLVRGILPASLSRGGLRTGIESLVADLPLPVDVEVGVPRLPPEVETTAYFVVAEALTNVVKHAGATRAQVGAALADGFLRVEIRDDGVGGAGPGRGSGLTGLFDRVEAGEGTLTIASPPGGGTTLTAALPLVAAG